MEEDSGLLCTHGRTELGDGKKPATTQISAHRKTSFPKPSIVHRAAQEHSEFEESWKTIGKNAVEILSETSLTFTALLIMF